MLQDRELPYGLPASVKANLAEMPREEYFEVQPNVKLHVRDWGEGRTILFIHGWPFSDEIFEYQFDQLCQQGFRCVGLTLRGFGKSDQPYGQYNFNIFADDLQKAICHLKLDNITLVGFSMGAAVALRYMSRHLQAWVSRLVLVSPAVPCWVASRSHPYGIPAAEADAMVALCYKDRSRLIHNFVEKLSDGRISEPQKEWLRVIAMQASPYATAQSLVALRDTELSADLNGISVPTAIFHGNKDQLCPFALSEQLQGRMKNAHLVTFPGAGHSIFLEEVENFNRELALFASEKGEELKIPG